MPVETATYISDLNSSYPQGTDAQAEGDNHLRLLKAVLKATFPSVTGAVTGSHTDINNAIAVSKGTAAGVLFAGTIGAPGLPIAGSLTSGLYSPGANQLAIAIQGALALLVDASKNTSMAGNLGVSGNLSITGTSAFTGACTGPGFMPIGGSMPWFSDTLPTGFGTWAWMNGQSVSAATYAALASVYPGLVSGGNVVLPDAREVTLVGKFNMGGSGSSPGRVTNYTLNTFGYIFGESTHQLSIGELAVHSHGVTDPGHTHGMPGGYIVGTSSVGATSGANPVPYGITGLPSTLTGYTGISINNAGSGTAHNNMQPGLTCNWIMRIA